jgi:hypothetical protein
MKTCIRCKELKDLEDFYAAANNKDGFNNTCK